MDAKTYMECRAFGIDDCVMTEEVFESENKEKITDWKKIIKEWKTEAFGEDADKEIIGIGKKVETTVTPLLCLEEYTIVTQKPGCMIGRHGETIDKYKKMLAERYNGSPVVNVKIKFEEVRYFF